MDEEKYQKELFEFEKPKRHFPRLSDLFPKADFENRVSVTLTLERIVFIAIGLIMFMVVIYALGVEAGKRSLGAASSETRISLVKAPLAVTAPKTAAGKPYTIFAASFSHREYAALAVNKMKAAGFDAFLSQSGDLFRLCTGAYSNPAAAQKDLLKVKRIYKDAFVKTK